MSLWPDAPPLPKPEPVKGGGMAYPVPPQRPSKSEVVNANLDTIYGDKERGYLEAKRHAQAALTRLGSMVTKGLIRHPRDSIQTRAMFDALRSVIAEIDEAELLILRDRLKTKTGLEYEYDKTNWQAKGYE